MDPGSVLIAPQAAHGNAAGTPADKVTAETDTVRRALVDQGFKNTIMPHGQRVGIDVEVAERNPRRRSGSRRSPSPWGLRRGVLVQRWFSHPAASTAQ